MTVTIPGYHITAACNRREHPMAAARRKDKQRAMVANVLWVEQIVKGNAIPRLPCAVTFVRVSPRALDDDNCENAFKSIRDEVAVWLGLPTRKLAKGQKWATADDRDPRVTWRYEQRQGKDAIEIRFEERSEA